MPGKRPRLNPESMLDALAHHIPFLKAFTVQDPGTDHLDPQELEALATARAMVETYFSLHMEEVHHCPVEGRALLVGNHGRTGIDAFIFAAVAPDFLRRPVRPLTDTVFFRLPVLREWIAHLGGVPGTRENATELLNRDELVVVYPGGSDEVLKPSFEAYQLTWGDRIGFVKVAAQTGTPIIPVAGLGVDDIYHNMPGWDAFEQSQVARWLEHLIGRRYRGMPPQIGLGPLPAPTPLTYRLGAPMSTQHLDPHDDAALLAFQRQVQEALQALLDDGLRDRKASSLLG